VLDVSSSLMFVVMRIPSAGVALAHHYYLLACPAVVMLSAMYQDRMQANMICMSAMHNRCMSK
jgi:hypothetical protein